MTDKELSEIFSCIKHDVEQILDYIIQFEEIKKTLKFENVMSAYTVCRLLCRKVPKQMVLTIDANWFMIYNEKLQYQQDMLILQRPYLQPIVTGMQSAFDEIKRQKLDYEDYFNAIEELERFNDLGIILSNDHEGFHPKDEILHPKDEIQDCSDNPDCTGNCEGCRVLTPKKE